MTPKQERFIEEYLIDLNATRAAIRAGYSPPGAPALASRLLKRPEVAEAVQAAVAERRRRTRITADRVLEEYARIAFADIRRLAKWGPDGVSLKPASEVSDADAAAIAEVSNTGARLKLHDKKAALDALARHLGMTRPPPGKEETATTDDPGNALAILRERLARLADSPE